MEQQIINPSDFVMYKGSLWKVLEIGGSEGHSCWITIKDIYGTKMDVLAYYVYKIDKSAVKEYWNMMTE